MNILIAPNAFKGTIKADLAAKIIKNGLLAVDSNLDIQTSPIADGGDGTCFLLANELGWEPRECTALDAIGRPKAGVFYLNKSQNKAMLDVSTVSGLDGLKPFQVDANLSSTYGTGELIVEAIKEGVNEVILGLGGSATVDMGTGILRALGFLFLDQNGREISMFGHGFISRIAHIQRPAKRQPIRFTCLCDVDNTFFGPKGAIPVFGPQKGIAPDDISAFEDSAKSLFQLLQKKSKGVLMDREGFGAAGGIALGLSAFFPVEIKSGAQYFFDQVKMVEKVKAADWIITGEGRFDSQSAGGKGSYELLQLVKSMGKKCLIITSGEKDEAIESGFDEVVLLPELDSNQHNYEDKAIESLKKSMQEFSWGTLFETKK
ncbi:glycerate kinase [Echinicola marina]|uniref:glycerate kinase family protein n=1 Tax=Echinicola marina TaxID=2859768 RepID=UPI001CF64FDD|nr:glycerate kinase [Echinicola marina]UCS93157.1 glycerate kinase [Echinicola marina]